LGFQVQLEAERADDQIDEHYLYLRGNWGRLTLGAENGIGHLMQVRAPRFIPGLKIYDNSLTDDVFETAFDKHIADEAIEDAHMSTKLEHISGDANKLSYVTPRVGGLQLGVSFTPNNAEPGGSANNAGESGEAMQEDIIELGVSYKGKARGVGYKLSYTSVDGDSTATGDDAADPKSSSTGFALTYGDWSFGGNLSEYQHLAAVDDAYADSETIETSNFGLKYRLNKVSHIGLGRTESEESQTGNAPKTEYEETTIGGGTKLRDGVQVGYYYTMSEASQAANDAEVSALGMTLALKF
jgi:outer membrane protein OmpU